MPRPQRRTNQEHTFGGAAGQLRRTLETALREGNDEAAVELAREARKMRAITPDEYMTIVQTRAGGDGATAAADGASLDVRPSDAVRTQTSGATSRTGTESRDDPNGDSLDAVARARRRLQNGRLQDGSQAAEDDVRVQTPREGTAPDTTELDPVARARQRLQAGGPTPDSAVPVDTTRTAAAMQHPGSARTGTGSRSETDPPDEEPGTLGALWNAVQRGYHNLRAGLSELEAQTSFDEISRQLSQIEADYQAEQARQEPRSRGAARTAERMQEARQETTERVKLDPFGILTMSGESARRAGIEPEERTPTEVERFGQAAAEDPSGAAQLAAELGAESVPSLGFTALAGGGGSSAGRIGAMWLAGSVLEAGQSLRDAATDPETGERRPVEPRDKALAIAGGVGAGAVEAIGAAGVSQGVRRLLDKANLPEAAQQAAERAIGRELRRYASETAKSGVGEGTTEVIQGIISDVAAQQGWDPEREIGDGWFQQFLAGFGAGSGVTSIAGAPSTVARAAGGGRAGTSQATGPEGPTGQAPAAAPSTGGETGPTGSAQGEQTREPDATGEVADGDVRAQTPASTESPVQAARRRLFDALAVATPEELAAVRQQTASPAVQEEIDMERRVGRGEDVDMATPLPDVVPEDVSVRPEIREAVQAVEEAERAEATEAAPGAEPTRPVATEAETTESSARPDAEAARLRLADELATASLEELASVREQTTSSVVQEEIDLERSAGREEDADTAVELPDVDPAEVDVRPELRDAVRAVEQADPDADADVRAQRPEEGTSPTSVPDSVPDVVRENPEQAHQAAESALEERRQRLASVLEETSTGELAALQEQTESPAVQSAIQDERARRGETADPIELPDPAEAAPIDAERDVARAARDVKVAEQAVGEAEAVLEAQRAEAGRPETAPAGAESDARGDATGERSAEADVRAQTQRPSRRPRSEKDVLEEVARTSEDPAEIALAYRQARDVEETQDTSSDVEQAIRDIGRVQTQSYEDVVGSNVQADEGVVRLRFLSRDGMPIDQVAQEVTQEVGREVSVQEVADTLRDMGTRTQERRTSDRLADRFEQVTGQRLTERRAEAAIQEAIEEEGEGAPEETTTDDPEPSMVAPFQTEGQAATPRSRSTSDPAPSEASEGDVRTQTPREGRTAAMRAEDGGSVEEGSTDGDENGRIPVDPRDEDGEDVADFRVMLEDLQSDTGVTIQRAELQAGVAGQYDPTDASVVQRRPNDVDTAIHEVAHALDDRYDVLGPYEGESTSPLDEELIPAFSQHGSGTASGERGTATYNRAEGFAEWLRAYAANPEAAREAAPRTYERFVEAVPESAREGVERFGRRWRQWAQAAQEGDPAATTANVELGFDEPSLVERIKERFSGLFEPVGVGDTFWDRLGQRVWESMRVTFKAWDLARAMQGMEELEVDEDFRALHKLFNGIDGVVETYIKSGLQTYDGEPVRGPDGQPLEGFASIFEPLLRSTKSELQEDLRALVALLINERVLEKGQNLRDAAEIIAAWPDLRAELVEDIEAQQKRVEEAKSILRAYREQGRRDGSIGQQKEAVKQSRQRLREKRRELREAREQVREAQDRLGYDGDPEGAMEYAERRISRLSGVGGGTQSDETVARTFLERLQEDPERYERLQTAAKRYRAWADGLLRRMVDAGMLTEQKYQQIKEENQYYAAFNRVPGREEAFVMGSVSPAVRRATGKLTGDRQILYRFKGSTRRLENPIASLLGQTFAVVYETEANRMKRAFVEPFRSDRGMYEGEVLELGHIVRRAKAGDERTITVHRDGEREYWQINDQLYDTWKEVERPDRARGAVEGLQRAIQTSRELITHAPPFVLRQLQRDPQEVAIKSDEGAKPWDLLTYATKEGREQFTEDLENLQTAGGANFGWYRSGREGYYEEQRRIIDDLAETDDVTTTFGRIRKAASGALEWYTTRVRQAESASRLGHFRRAYERYQEQGYDEFDARRLAARDTRDLLDFARGGTVVKELNRYLLFLNAAVQGIRSAIETGAKKSAAKYAARIMLVAVLPDIAVYTWNAMAGGEDELERWRQEPAYLKDFFYTFRIPLPGGEWQVLRVPKTYEYGLISSLFVRGLDGALHLATDGERGGSRPFAGYEDSALKGLVPIHPEAVLTSPALAPVAAAANRDFFRGEQIVPPYEAKRDLDLREGTRYASRLGQQVQELVGVDARKIDFLIRNLSGGTGRLFMTASDVGKDDTAGREFWMDATGLFVHPPVYGSRDVQYVLDWAEDRGKMNLDAVERLQDMVGAVYEAKTAEERRTRAERLWEYARQVRDDIEARADEDGSTPTSDASAGAPGRLLEEMGFRRSRTGDTGADDTDGTPRRRVTDLLGTPSEQPNRRRIEHLFG